MKLEPDDELIQLAYAAVRNQEVQERIEGQDLPEKVPVNTRMILRMVDMLIQLRMTVLR
jgi:hypothetical protein